MTIALGLLAAAFPASASANRNTELDTIRARWVAFLTASDQVPNAPATTAALEKLNALTDESAREQKPDGTWTADMNGQPSNNSAIWPIIYHRMRPLAQAWATPGARRYHDPATVEVLVRALNTYLPELECDAKDRPGNWWIWDIGCPMDLGNVLLIINDSLPPEMQTRAIAVLTSLLRLDGDDSATEGVYGRKLRGKNTPGPLTGQNAIWVNMARMRLGLLTHNPDLVRVTAGDVASVCARLARADHYHEGVTPDGSYLIHGPQIMWSYGAGQVGDTGLATMLLAGTSFALPPSAVSFQEDLLLDSAAWCSTQYLMHPMIIGRDWSRNGAPHANGFLLGAMMLALSEGPRHAECAALAKEWLAISDTVGGIPDAQLGLAARVKALPGEPAKPLDGCRAFPDGDYLAIQRPGWGGGIKMYSARTWPYEIVNGEGLTSLHNSDGSLFLVTKPTDWPLPVMAALDWAHLPGTTISAEQHVDKWNEPGETTFVGSIADGRSAVAAQDLKVKELHAHKSWLVFGDAIVCLGNGIVSPTPADTTVAQTPITAETTDFVVNGKPVVETGDAGISLGAETPKHWAVAGDTGYVFSRSDLPLFIRKATRARAKRVINANGSDQPLAPVTFAEIFVPHGAPKAEAPAWYAYTILPRTNARSTAIWADRPPITILRQTDNVHAAMDMRTNQGAAVFWNAGEAGDLRVDAPCIALWKSDGEKVMVTLADPTRDTRKIRVDWKGTVEKVVEVKDGRPASVTF